MGINALLATADRLLSRGGNPRKDGWRAAGWLLLPSALLFGVFGLYPIVACFQLSFRDGYYGQGAYTGAQNYREALSSPDYWNSVRVTGYYLVGTVPTTIVLGFIIARLLTQIVRFRALFRTVYFLPYVTSAFAAALVWRAILHPRDGAANHVLEFLGLPAQQFLLEPRGLLHIVSAGWFPADWGPSLALCCVIVFDIWHGLGFAVVILLAGLSAVPRELEDAARIDGATSWQVLRHVTLPLISPTLYFLLIIGTIQGFQAFNSFYALTKSGGNTLGTTENLVLYLFENFYENGRWGYGAAIATLLLGLIIGLTLLQAHWVRKGVHYS